MGNLFLASPVSNLVFLFGIKEKTLSRKEALSITEIGNEEVAKRRGAAELGVGRDTAARARDCHRPSTAMAAAKTLEEALQEIDTLKCVLVRCAGVPLTIYYNCVIVS